MDLWVNNLEDSISEKEIAEAVSKVEGCTPDNVKVGTRRTSLSRLGVSAMSRPGRKEGDSG